MVLASMAQGETLNLKGSVITAAPVLDYRRALQTGSVFLIHRDTDIHMDMDMVPAKVSVLRRAFLKTLLFPMDPALDSPRTLASTKALESTKVRAFHKAGASIKESVRARVSVKIRATAGRKAYPRGFRKVKIKGCPKECLLLKISPETKAAALVFLPVILSAVQKAYPKHRVTARAKESVGAKTEALGNH